MAKPHKESLGVPVGYESSPAVAHFFPFNVTDAAVSFAKDFLASGVAVAISKTVVAPIKQISNIRA